MTITWSASNAGKTTRTIYPADSIEEAAKSGRYFINYGLGHGVLKIFVDGIQVRQDRMSMSTNYKWSVITDKCFFG